MSPLGAIHDRICMGELAFEFRWHLVLVWRLEIDSLVCFVVNRTPHGTNKSHYFLIGEETEFVFVSLYGFDRNLVTDPVFLNEKDGKIGTITALAVGKVD